MTVKNIHSCTHYFYFILCQDISVGGCSHTTLPPRDHSPSVDDLTNVSISSSFDVPNI